MLLNLDLPRIEDNWRNCGAMDSDSKLELKQDVVVVVQSLHSTLSVKRTTLTKEKTFQSQPTRAYHRHSHH